MDKIKTLLKRFNSATPFAIALIIVGLVLLVLPGSSLKTVCLLLGIVVLIKGIIKLADYIKKKNEESAGTRDLISVIFTFFLAFVLVIHPERLLSIIPVLIGFSVFVYGITSFLKAEKTLLSKVFSAITMVIGLTIVASPFALAEFITAVIGIGFIIIGVIIIINNNKIKKLKSDIEDELSKDENGYMIVDYKDVDE